MKAIIQELFYDKEMVNRVKEQNVNEGLLYNQLISGKISLKEFLHLSNAS